MSEPDDLAVSEGDDVDISERPIRVILFGGHFVSTDDSETVGMSATGPDALETLAMRLFQAGFDVRRPLVMYRGGQYIGRISIGKAAGVCDGCVD